jgi:hypothetical protein
MSWPYPIPADLRPRLAGAMSARNFGPAEVWGEVRDWLEAHGVTVPDSLMVEQPAETAQRDQ